MLVPAITDGNEPGEPDARKPARPVRERVVGNVSTSRVRERRVLVSIALASPFGDEVTR